MSERTLYTAEEVATALRVTRRTVYEWLKIGRLHGTRVGRGWRIRPEDIEAFTRPGVVSGPLADGAEQPAVLSDEEHAKRVDTIFGKYAWVPTSGEEFSRRKREENEEEERRWDERPARRP
jgi:excisionase family DNA binding protein